jgi:hypothetical protein
LTIYRNPILFRFEEKRQLLKAIRDRKDQLFGPNAAKMKPNVKQGNLLGCNSGKFQPFLALWDEVISVFKVSFL